MLVMKVEIVDNVDNYVHILLHQCVGDVDKIVEIKKIGMSNKEESCRMGIQPFRQLYLL